MSQLAASVFAAVARAGLSRNLIFENCSVKYPLCSALIASKSALIERVLETKTLSGVGLNMSGSVDPPRSLRASAFDESAHSRGGRLEVSSKAPNTPERAKQNDKRGQHALSCRPIDLRINRRGWRLGFGDPQVNSQGRRVPDQSRRRDRIFVGRASTGLSSAISMRAGSCRRRRSTQ